MYVFLVYFAALTTPMPYEVKVQGVMQQKYRYTVQKSVVDIIGNELEKNINRNYYLNHILIWWAWKEQLRDYEDFKNNYGYCWGLKSNIELIFRRLEHFKDVPYINYDDDRLIPFYSTCTPMLEFLPEHIKTLERKKKLHIQYSSDYQYYIDKEVTLYNAWQILTGLSHQHTLIRESKGNYYMYRYLLNDYLKLVGPELYYSGSWPQLDPTVFYLFE